MQHSNGGNPPSWLQRRSQPLRHAAPSMRMQCLVAEVSVALLQEMPRHQCHLAT